MPGSKIVDRPPVEVLLDDGGADIGGTRDGRRVPKPFGDAPHDGYHRALLFGLAVDEATVRKGQCGKQRPAPRPEVLRGELLAHVDLDVVVQPLRREVV